MDTKLSLKHLVDQRDQQFKLETQEIIATALRPLTEALRIAFNDDSQFRDADWCYVDINDEDMVILRGELSIEIGDVVVLDNGEEMTVSEDIAEFLTRIVKITVPLDIVENGDMDDIIDFIENRTKKDIEPEKRFPKHQPTTIETDALYGFELEDLEDQQIQKLLHSAKIIDNDTGNKH